jgi:hypothetical protein
MENACGGARTREDISGRGGGWGREKRGPRDLLASDGHPLGGSEWFNPRGDRYSIFLYSFYLLCKQRVSILLTDSILLWQYIIVEYSIGNL